jgi:hypothetical protein
MKFSIRDLLWLTAVVALASGWWADRSSLRNEISKLEKEVEWLRDPPIIAVRGGILTGRKPLGKRATKIHLSPDSHEVQLAEPDDFKCLT